MAKKKRLNKRAVVLLSIVGAVAVVGMTAVIISHLPVDVSTMVAKGDAAYAAANYPEAVLQYDKAIGASKGSAQSDYYVRRAKAQRDWINVPSLNQTERIEHYRAMKSSLQAALRANRTSLDAQRMLTDILWSEANQPQIANWSEFLREVDLLLKLAPNDHQLIFRRARAKTELIKSVGETYVQSALQDYLKAIELKSDSIEYWVRLAEFQRQYNHDPSQAAATYEQAIARNPKETMLKIAYAEYLSRDGKKDKALDVLKKAREADKNNADLLATMGQFYAGQNDPDNAIAMLKEAISQDPANYRSYQILSILYFRQQKADEGLTVLRQGLATVDARLTTAPATGPADMAAMRLTEGKRRLHEALATALLTMAETQTDQKAKYIQEARASQEILAPLDRLVANQLAGRIALIENKPDEAAKLLEPVYRAQEGNLQTGYLLFTAYVRMGQPAKAEKVADQIIATGDERAIEGHVLKAQIQISYHAYSEAGKELTAALQANPEHARARELRGLLVALTSGTVTEGMNVDPQSVRALLGRASSLWLEGHQAEAVKLAEELNTRVPENLDVVNLLLRMYMASKRQADAEGLLQRAIDKNKDNAALKQAQALIAEKDPAKQRQMMLDAAETPLEKARICMAFGDQEGMEKFLKEAAEKDPKSMPVIEAQLGVALQKKDWEQAQACVDRAIAIDKPQGKFLAARMLTAKNDFKGAIVLLLEILKDRPDSKPVRVILGDCYMQVEQYAKAEEAYLAVADVDRGFTAAIIGLAKATAKLGKGPEHEQYVEMARRQAPDDEYINGEYLRQQMVKMRPEDALVEFETRRKQQPADLNNLLWLGVTYERLKSMDKAEEAYRDCYQRAKDKLQGAGPLLAFYLRANKTTEIDRILDELRDQSDKVGALIVRGSIRQEQKQSDSFALAKAAYQAAIDADHQDVRGFDAMARLLSSQGLWVEAIAAKQASANLKPSPDKDKDMARMMIAAKMIDEAIKRLEVLRKTLPDDPQVLVHLAVAYAQKDQADQAQSLLDQAVKMNPNMVEARLTRATLAMTLGQSNRAREDILAALPRVNDDEMLRRVAALLLRLADDKRAENQQKAEDILTGLRNRNAGYWPAAIDLAQLYLQQKKWERLDPLLAQCRKDFPKQVEFLQLDGESAKRRGLTDKRVAIYAEAMKLSRDRMTVVQYVQALLDAGKFDDVDRVTQEQMGLADSGAWVKALRASSLAKQKKLLEAQELFKSAMETRDVAEMRFVLTQMEQAMGLTAAIAQMETWRAGRPADWQFNMALAEWYHKSETVDNARKGLDLLKVTMPLDTVPIHQAEMNVLMGLMLQKLKQADDAERAYKAALNFDKDNVKALNNLAYLYVSDKDQPQEAVKYAQLAAKQLPDNPDVLDTLGWALTKAKQNDAAEQVLLRTTSMDNSPVLCRYHLAYLYEQKGDLEKARAQYRAGLTIVGNDTADASYSVLKDGLERVQKKLGSKE